MAGSSWTDAENDEIVADYFAMLAADLAGAPYTKSRRNRALQDALGRSHGSIEFKHQNISAVLKSLGQTWIAGYKPAFNFQNSLVDAVLRWLADHEDWGAPQEKLTGFAETSGALWIGPPPTRRNEPPPKELEQMMFVAAKFDVAARDARNRKLGRAGEARVLAHERATLSDSGRHDLSQRVRWVSEEDGDGAGYDIQSFEIDGRPRLIEVKTTNGWERTPFHVSRNEIARAESDREHWLLLRLWNFARESQAFEIRPPLEAHVALTPTSFLAHLR